jgi:hypothetical protein
MPIDRRRRITLPAPSTTVEAWRRGERERILPRLVAVTPDDVADRSADGVARVRAVLERALAGERRRARARHWSYSLARHVGLIEALDAERLLFAETKRRRRRER